MTVSCGGDAGTRTRTGVSPSDFKSRVQYGLRAREGRFYPLLRSSCVYVARGWHPGFDSTRQQATVSRGESRLHALSRSVCPRGRRRQLTAMGLQENVTPPRLSGTRTCPLLMPAAGRSRISPNSRNTPCPAGAKIMETCPHPPGNPPPQMNWPGTPAGRGELWERLPVMRSRMWQRTLGSAFSTTVFQTASDSAHFIHPPDSRWTSTIGICSRAGPTPPERRISP